MVLLGDEAQVLARFSPFGDDVILMQDRCTVCTERTTVSEIVLDSNEGTARRHESCGISLVRLVMVLVCVQDWCTVCAKHTIGTDIVLDAPDGTPR